MWVKVKNYIVRRKYLCLGLGIYFVVMILLTITLLTSDGQPNLATNIFPSLKKIEQPVAAPSATTVVSKKDANTSTDSDESDSSGGSGESANGDAESSGGESGEAPETITASVAFYADTQSDSDEEDANHSRVVEYILGKGSNPVFHAGDLMEDGTQNSLDRFNAVTAGLRSARTFYAALGNNDRVEGDSSTPSALYFANFSFPGNERWYSVNIGNLHMVVLDSAFASLSPGSAQYSWLEADLQSEAATSRVVGIMAHHPSYVGSISGLINSYGVDFTIAGHNHSYNKSESNGTYNFILSGQPGIGYIIANIYSGGSIKIYAYSSGNGVIDSAIFSNQ